MNAQIKVSKSILLLAIPDPDYYRDQKDISVLTYLDTNKLSLPDNILAVQFRISPKPVVSSPTRFVYRDVYDLSKAPESDYPSDFPLEDKDKGAIWLIDNAWDRNTQYWLYIGQTDRLLTYTNIILGDHPIFSRYYSQWLLGGLKVEWDNISGGIYKTSPSSGSKVE